jgi:hypothetical protein
VILLPSIFHSRNFLLLKPACFADAGEAGAGGVKAWSQSMTHPGRKPLGAMVFGTLQHMVHAHLENKYCAKQKCSSNLSVLFLTVSLSCVLVLYLKMNNPGKISPCLKRTE